LNPDGRLDKPVRILASDDAALTVIAGLLQRGRAEVIHAALAEYILSHREELGSLFDETKAAIAADDLDALTKRAAAGLESQIDALVADLPM
jgi:hypothetical protein